MGKRKRQQRENASKSERRSTEGVRVYQEADAETTIVLDAWSVDDIVQDATISKLNSSCTFSDVGLQLARRTIESMQEKSSKKQRESRSSVQIKPYPIQLNMWPLLLDSLQPMIRKSDDDSKNINNICGISQTGSGKTLSYCIPMVAACIQKLASPTSPDAKLFVHGIVLCPTRELAIQVAREMKMVMKVANKMLKVAATGESAARKVESLAIYGGVDIQSQLISLGQSNDASTNEDETAWHHKSLAIAATPGRLLDILKQLRDVKEPTPVFQSVSLIVFDEADRMALNSEMSNQIDEVLDILQTMNTTIRNDFVRCLVSATLPEKAKDVIDKWVPCPRCVIKIDSVTVGENQAGKTFTDGMKGGDPDITIAEKALGDKSKHTLPANLDLATIPSNLVQTLHVCANHKKPKKLITTLKRIYQNGSRSNSNKLCIVFFAQIKTLKFIGNLLRKEGELIFYCYQYSNSSTALNETDETFSLSGFKCIELFGTLKQDEREQRLLSFKAGKFLTLHMYITHVP
jgi:superfamily II DNA/RNA helicase